MATSEVGRRDQLPTGLVVVNVDSGGHSGGEMGAPRSSSRREPLRTGQRSSVMNVSNFDCLLRVNQDYSRRLILCETERKQAN